MDDIKNYLINECPSCGAPDQGGQFCDYCKRRLRTPKIVSTQELYAGGLCVAIYEKFSDGKTVVMCSAFLSRLYSQQTRIEME